LGPVLAPHYPRGVQLEVNGRVVARDDAPAGEVAPIEVRMLTASELSPAAADLRGILEQVLRKRVITRTFKQHR